ncbi:DUF3576 domain-containing protein [Candidatus Pelagibacter sp.]|nr:DUF3576 domain-containing protein [Candidatus Pelagibacter sp.]
MSNYKTIKTLFVLFFSALIMISCGSIPKPDWSKTIEPNATKRAQQNVKEGRGTFFNLEKKGDGSFLFASSNPMWKSTLDALSFISLANVDYSGGVIITDWYSDGNPDESIKIVVRFLSNEIRADGLVVNLYKRNCSNDKCSTKEIKSDLNLKIKDKILTKAVIYKNEYDTEFKKNKPKKVYKD